MTEIDPVLWKYAEAKLGREISEVEYSKIIDEFGKRLDQAILGRIDEKLEKEALP